MQVEYGEWVVRLSVALLVAMVFGLNRNLQHRAAGVRTLALVALSTCGLVLAISAYAPHNFDAMTRTVQGIVSGIGFIGAGVILHRQTSLHVMGLTTAAMVWFVAAMGILCGLGLLELVGVVSVFAAIALVIGRPLERWVYQTVRGKPSPPTVSGG